MNSATSTQKLNNIVFVVVFLILAVIIATSVYLAFIAFPWLVREIASLYLSSGVEFKLGLITAVLSTTGVVWSVIFQRRKEIEALRFERKREAYSAFFDLLFEFMAASDSKTDISESPETKQNFRNIMKKMMIWGSPNTINSFNDYIANSVKSDNPKVVFARIETLLRQFRTDLGHKDRKLKRFALTKLIIRGDEHHTLD